MKILILQHIKIEDPGFIKDLMIKDGAELTTIELDEGEKIPNDLNKFDAMFCMGGPMDTWMEKEYPWLIDEKKKIKEFVVTLKKPYLGFCLGCQLLGESVGGKVVKSNPAEIGMMDINFSNKKNNDSLFSSFPNKIKSLQWHSYEVNNQKSNKDVGFVRKKDFFRITLTLRCLNNSRSIFLWAPGKKKSYIVKKILSDRKFKYPASFLKEKNNFLFHSD